MTNKTKSGGLKDEETIRREQYLDESLYFSQRKLEGVFIGTTDSKVVIMIEEE